MTDTSCQITTFQHERIHDSAPVNSAAVRKLGLSHVADLPCIPHVLSYAGKKVDLPHCVQFFRLWRALTQHSHKVKEIWAAAKGTKIPTPSDTR